jgi:hypothetical protein
MLVPTACKFFRRARSTYERQRIWGPEQIYGTNSGAGSLLILLANRKIITLISQNAKINNYSQEVTQN